MSGSHATEDGRSGLTDKDQIEYGFYREDCELLGIKPAPQKVKQRMVFLISQNKQRKFKIKTVCYKIWTSEFVLLSYVVMADITNSDVHIL